MRWHPAPDDRQAPARVASHLASYVSFWFPPTLHRPACTQPYSEGPDQSHTQLENSPLASRGAVGSVTRARIARRLFGSTAATAEGCRMEPGRIRLFVLLAVALPIGVFAHFHTSRAQKSPPYKPEVPKTWDEAALADLEVPLAVPSNSAKHISAEGYYALPVRPIYKSYPRYHPDYEPAGYCDWLLKQEPIVLWGEGAHRPALDTEEDWIDAGQ